MDRRTVLGTLSGGISIGLAGCQMRQIVARSTTESMSTVERDDHVVTVTKRVEHGQTDLERVVRLQDGGHLQFELTCQDGTTKTASTVLPSDEWRNFERLVLKADVDEFKSAYECTGNCPTDGPVTSLTFEIDDEKTKLQFESRATLPTQLEDILTKIESFKENINPNSC